MCSSNMDHAEVKLSGFASIFLRLLLYRLPALTNAREKRIMGSIGKEVEEIAGEGTEEGQERISF